MFDFRDDLRLYKQHDSACFKYKSVRNYGFITFETAYKSYHMRKVVKAIAMMNIIPTATVVANHTLAALCSIKNTK